MSNNTQLPSGLSVMQRPTQKITKLQRLIDTNPYPAALAAIKKKKEDCGYTEKWYREELRKMNREWLAKVQDAIQENQRYIGERQAEIEQVGALNFEPNYTERDFADLQYMQNLIKTRIVMEGQGNDTLIGRIIDDYINTQVGARAIMFLTGDSEVGQALKPYYPTAAQNAKTAAERKFEADKAEKLDKLERALIPYLQADVIGSGMLDQAQEMVGRGIVEVGDEIYFDDNPDDGKMRQEVNSVFYRPL